MLRDPARLQALLETYASMTGLDGYDAASRGRKFNDLIAAVLRCWGIDATPNIRESGEIDVGFELEGTHFVLEAKWETEPSDTAIIAKLQKRLRQRLQETIGIIASMAGFTSNSLEDLKQGEQLAVLCLSREHVEAFLSGFTPPLNSSRP